MSFCKFTHNMLDPLMWTKVTMYSYTWSVRRGARVQMLEVSFELLSTEITLVMYIQLNLLRLFRVFTSSYLIKSILLKILTLSLTYYCSRFVPEKFEEIFKKHANENADSLTYNEVKEMLKTNRKPKDYYGWYPLFLCFLFVVTLSVSIFVIDLTRYIT